MGGHKLPNIHPKTRRLQVKRVGFVGWRGMVGSVLMYRMRQESDFTDIQPTFFTTSQAGQKAPHVGKDVPVLHKADDIETLKTLDAIVTCHGVDSPHARES